MVATLLVCDRDDSGLLEQVVLYASAVDSLLIRAKIHQGVFTEAR